MEMDEAYANYDCNDEDCYYMWLPLENDDDALPLAQALQGATLTKIILEGAFELFLEVLPGFTERGAHVLAEGIRLAKVQHIRFKADSDDNEHDVAVVLTLYREGNQPRFIETQDCKQSVSFALECEMLRQNDKNYTSCYIHLSCIDPFVLANAMQGNTGLKYLSLRGGREDLTEEAAHALATAIRCSKVNQLSFGHFQGDDNDELVRIICDSGIKQSGRLFDVFGL